MPEAHRGGWPGPRKETLTVRLLPALRQRLKAHADKHRGGNQSAVVSDAITEYLDRHDTETEEQGR